MASPRATALKLLVRLEKDKAYSNILLDKELSKTELDERDKRFVSALFYGIIERKITLDAVIDKYSKVNINKLDSDVLQILRMGIYQLLFMDNVPDSASVNESVKLAKKLKNPSLSGFVNGILRAFLRDNKQIPLTGSEYENLSVLYSCPLQLIKKWDKEYGKETTLSLVKSSVGKPPLTVRVNSVKATDEKAAKLLSDDGFEVKRTVISHCLEISGGKCSIENSKAYSLGIIHVQDISSQLCSLSLGAEPGETVIDICSAPGGKTFTIAEAMENKGEIIACDLHEKRVHLIQQGAVRLGLNIVKAQVNDGAVFNDKFPIADKILCDVPCSGLGVIRRKPEIKYKDYREFHSLPEIQYEILKTSSRYLKVGGIIIYSTCTVSKAENEDVIKRFLMENSNFKEEIISKDYEHLNDYKATIIPDYYNSDGFFICKMKRVE